MMPSRHSRRVAHAALAFLFAIIFLISPGCSSSNATPPAAGEASSTASPAQAAESTPDKLNMEELFPPGAGRDLILNNCQNCHTFVPILILQMDKDAWQRNSLDHRERVSNLTDDEFKTVYQYLTTNFGPHRPVPNLPPDLLKSWTSY